MKDGKVTERCPRCVSLAWDQHRKAKDIVKDKYGVVNKTLYDNSVQLLWDNEVDGVGTTNKLDERVETSWEAGVLKMVYDARCEACGWHVCLPVDVNRFRLKEVGVNDYELTTGWWDRG